MTLLDKLHGLFGRVFARKHTIDVSRRTQLFFIDPTGTTAIFEVDNVVGIESMESSDFLVRVDVDPYNKVHTLLHTLSETTPRQSVQWLVGWSDGSCQPDIDSEDGFILPNKRTWLRFSGPVSGFSFNFSEGLGGVVTGEMIIDGVNYIWKERTDPS